MHNQQGIQLQTGKLQISVTQARYPLDTLLTFGARQNPKRRYLFISKVLGKYIPCLPSDMRQTYSALVENIALNCHSNTWVLGVAETATGLGAGVAEELNRKIENDVIYSHTTRCNLPDEVAFSIVEEHSHAPSHLIYALSKDIDKQSIETVVIVDDEISTGRTLEQLTVQLQCYLPHLKQIIWTSLVNWLPPTKRDDYTRKNKEIDLSFNSLLDGQYQFTNNPQFNAPLPENTASGISDSQNRSDTGRTSLVVTTKPLACFSSPEGINLTPQQLDKQTPYTVIGTGEFTYQPFLFAEQLQHQGFDVLFQSTGRSPMLEGAGIQRKESFYDEKQQGLFYLYNQPDGRTPILLYESIFQYENCPFREKLNAICAILNEG